MAQQRRTTNDQRGVAESLAWQEEIGYLRAKVEDLSSLIEVSIIINSTNDLDSLIGLVMEKAQSVMKAEASSVMLKTKDDTLECAWALGEVGEQVKKKMHLKIGEGIAGWVAEHGSPLIVPDVSKDPRFSSRIDRSTGFQTRTILAAPLIVKEKLIGVAEVINRVDGKAFDEDDLKLFSTFCRQVALAIENARMYHLELEKQKLEQQLQAAKVIQQSFMPENFPSSEDQQFEVAAQTTPATAVGGDFYDFIEFDKDTLGVTVGDVSGKGIPAALFMARLVSDFRLYTQVYQDPAQVMEILNNTLSERSRQGMFVTFQYGVLNASEGRFAFANAGHIPFIRVSPLDNKVELLNHSKGVPLGIVSGFSYGQSEVRLKKGDRIIMITDGVIEAKNKTGQPYSLERVLEFLTPAKKSVEAMVDALMQEIHRFSAGSPQHDDITIVGLKWG
ncbi:MAG: PP2C family protein-serine/threonine phosphatase [bacterium]